MTQKQQPKIEWGFYAVVPRVVRTQYKNLSHAEKWLYTCLKDLCGDKGTCFRTLRSLSEETDISIGSLSTMIPHLHEEGLIHAEKKKRSVKGKEVWHITIADIWQSNHEYCSKIEQAAQDVQEMNKDVQKLNEPTPDRSEIEPHCSNFVDRRITHKNNSIEEYKDEEQESTSTVPTSPTTSSHDEDAHALSCSLCSETDDIQPCRECGTRLCYEHRRDFPDKDGPTEIYCVPCVEKHNRAMAQRHQERTPIHDAHTPSPGVQSEPSSSTPSQLPSGDATRTQESKQTDSLIASTTPTTATAEPVKAARKPRAPRKPKMPLLDLDEETRTRVVKVLDCLDSWRQEMTGNPDQRYSREDLQAIDAIVKILPLKPTPKRLRQICDGMWNTPRDIRTGFHWQKHMTVVNICKQYDTQSLELDAKEKKAASSANNISILYSRPPAQAGDDEEELRFREPQSKRLALARKRG